MVSKRRENFMPISGSALAKCACTSFWKKAAFATSKSTLSRAKNKARIFKPSSRPASNDHHVDLAIVRAKMLALRHRSTLGGAQAHCRDGKRNVDMPGGGSPALDRRSTPPFMRHTSQIAIVGAILAIAAALARNNGEYDNIGLVFVAIALALAT